MQRKICRDIAKAFEEQLTYPGEIKVTVVREITLLGNSPLTIRVIQRDHSAVRILFIGDIVGKPGCRIVCEACRSCAARAARSGRGQRGECGGRLGTHAWDLREAGPGGGRLRHAGDHIYRRSEIIPVLIDQSNVVKPANFPDSAPGRSWTVVQASNGIAVGVFTVLGRIYMRPTDCPFAASDRVLREMPAEVVVRLVDVHAEATSDKQLLGRYLDGRVSAVLGTHTHVTTADEQILPGGTAFQCDVGMTGPFDSILGRKSNAYWKRRSAFGPLSFRSPPETCGCAARSSTSIRRPANARPCSA